MLSLHFTHSNLSMLLKGFLQKIPQEQLVELEDICNSDKTALQLQYIKTNLDIQNYMRVKVVYL